jgi:hypothetical protein
MKLIRILAVAALAATLAGCAGSVSKPTEMQALTVDKAALKITDITADAADGVTMSDGDFGIVAQKVRGYIELQSPGVIADSGGLRMTIHFTRFDRGNAFARAMLIGLGQIVIEATVTLTDASGAKVGEYKVSKDFALGGLAGATTTVEDVEDGFAKSVAEIVKKS